MFLSDDDKNFSTNLEEESKNDSQNIQIDKDYFNHLETFKLLYSEAPLPYQLVNLDGEILTINKQWSDLLGYKEKEVIGTCISKYVQEEDISRIKDEFGTFIKTKKLTNFVLNMQTKENKKLCVAVDGIILKSGKKSKTHCILRDITQKKINENKIKQALVVFENTNEGILITDKNNNIISVNNAFTKITKYTKEDVLGKNPSILNSSKHKDEFYSNMWEYLKENDSWAGEIFNRKKSGKIYPEWLNINIIRNEKGEIENYIGLFSDITKIKESESMISYLTHNDALTNLPNRLLLTARLKYSMERAYENYHNLAVISIDINNLKNINDSYGYILGDKAIVILAKRLKQIIKHDDTLARVSGNEFVIVLEKIVNIDDMSAIINRIFNTIKEEILLNKNTITISACLGVSIYPNHGLESEDLLRHSETALHNAKKLGINQYKFYNEYMTEDAIKKIKMEHDIKHAIKNNEFEVFYQPQINIKSKQIIGAEALLRWNHPEKGILTPDKFIKHLETSENIIIVGKQVLLDACNFFKYLNDENILKDGKVAVNLASEQINNSDIVNTIEEILNETKLEAKNLELEVVESSIIKDTNKVITLFEQLKKSNVKLAIDDFGTGYSSLSYIKQFPIDKLKIDKSFITDVSENQKDKAIVKTIVELGKGLGLKVIAEGVETKEQENYLKNNTNCDEIQGWLYSKALNQNDFKDFIKFHNENI